jgi:AAA domain
MVPANGKGGQTAPPTAIPSLDGVEVSDAPRTVSPGSPGFFERNTEERTEVIEGLLREGQLAAFAGPFGMGKSPVLLDLTVRFINGLAWCGRKVEQRPVVAIDCETPGPEYRRAISAIAARFAVPVPRVPEELEVYLESDSAAEPNTAALLKAVTTPGHLAKLGLIKAALCRKPNAVVMIDPLEMFFRLDTCKKPEVLELYRGLRTMLASFPRAVLLNTFNLRKRDKRGRKANLLADPRDWLEEVCGSLDLLNRSDVRLGIDEHAEDVRVINGIVRGREMHPFLIKSFRNPEDQLAGFEQLSPDQLDLMVGLSETQRRYWESLPQEFRFEDVAGRLVPRSSLSRLLSRTKSFGAVRQDEDGVFRKVSTERPVEL